MKKKSEEVVQIPSLEKKEFTIRLIGDTPLIVHCWSDKAKKMMLDKQTQGASSGREAKDPFIDFCDSLYWISERPENPTMEDVLNGTFGVPITGIKSSAVDGGFLSGATAKKTVSRGAFYIIGDTPELVKINGVPEMREDMVRIGIGTADIRYRAEFKKWSIDLRIQYNPKMMSMAQIINLFNFGGFCVGLCDWRPSKDGQYGMYHVAVGDESI